MRLPLAAISAAVALQAEKGTDAAVELLVNHGCTPNDAREILYIAEDPAGAAGRI